MSRVLGPGIASGRAALLVRLPAFVVGLQHVRPITFGPALGVDCAILDGPARMR